MLVWKYPSYDPNKKENKTKWQMSDKKHTFITYKMILEDVSANGQLVVRILIYRTEQNFQLHLLGIYFYLWGKKKPYLVPRQIYCKSNEVPNIFVHLSKSHFCCVKNSEEDCGEASSVTISYDPSAWKETTQN